MSQCVFYSLFLGFPKSRHLFNQEFRNRIIALFAYLYNGLNTQNNFSIEHWDLDLGKGNIIEKYLTTNEIYNNKKEENLINLPDISDFDKLIKNNLRNQELKLNSHKKKENEKKMTVTTTILNTPLYRLYAEQNRFETLNMIKPIKFSQRKVMDINLKDKQHSEYVKTAKEALKNVYDRKQQYSSFAAQNEKVFNEKL